MVPYNVDSFILVSAGSDGEYGTDDDVTNFQRKGEDEIPDLSCGLLLSMLYISHVLP